MSQLTTASGFIRKVEDITFRGARQQSCIDAEVNNSEGETLEGSIPVSFTPEQVKSYLRGEITKTKDPDKVRFYEHIISLEDELETLRKENVHLTSKLSLFEKDNEYDNQIGKETNSE